jgi:site-specific DNA-methyltransferase (adenine-specific)
LELDKLYNEDCIAGMGRIPSGTVDLAFADPPFNIGYKYDVYEDRRAAEDYLAWTNKWGEQLVRTLKPTGTFWLAIGDEFAAEMKLIFQRDLGLFCRSWVIWYYTFGVNCKYKFSRSHTHLFHFVKDPKEFTFNTMAIRVPSARQMVYADSRAHSKGRLPDDTWILRPQDAPTSFVPREDVWYFPRVCGTFKERAGWHGCQMPEQLLARIIRSCSNVDDTVLDPFGGSGTTLVVAKKLKRHFVGFELSKNYAEQIVARLDAAMPGDPLSGATEPSVKAPPTAAGKQRHTASESDPIAPVLKRSNVSDINRGITEAFFAIRNGFPPERVIVDPDFNEQFIATCTRLGLPGTPFEWNHRLMNLRKAGDFRGLPRSSRTTFPFSEKEFYRYKFACEIAIQRFKKNYDVTLDHVLCDPAMARDFDRLVLTMLPDEPSSLMIRWFALRIRKKASEIVQESMKISDLIPPRPRHAHNPFDLESSKTPASPGLYWLSDEHRNLYVGETDNLLERLQIQFGHKKFDFWQSPLDKLRISFRKVDEIPLLPQFQSRWISKWHPIGNFEKLAASQ